MIYHHLDVGSFIAWAFLSVCQNTVFDMGSVNTIPSVDTKSDTRIKLGVTGDRGQGLMCRLNQ